MFVLSLVCLALGIILIFVSSRNGDQQVRKIGTGLVIAAAVIFLVGRLGIPLGPSS